MTVKKEYNIGDSVWIHGIVDGKLAQGRVIHSVELNGHTDVHYIIEVPTSIEPLLEIRSWQTISQSPDGPVGAVRGAVANNDGSKRFLKKIGIEVDPTLEEHTSEEIHAALERSTTLNSLPPLPKGRSRKRKW